MAQQLALDLALRPALSREDFLVSPANAAAVAVVDQWPAWPTYAAIIVGPAGSGKTHLASVWQQVSSAPAISGQELRVDAIADLMAGNALVVEDADAGVDERALFHALNLARQQGGHMLLTAERPPAQWSVALPDLRSRLQSLPVTAILPPDDDLLRGVLVKLFSDRQVAVDEALVTYLVARMPRSLEVAQRLVSALDARALAEGVSISRPFAGRVLATLVGDESA